MEITINLFWILIVIGIFFIFLILNIISFLFHNGFSINLFSKHDNKIIDKFLEKYPDVTSLFMNKSLKEQNIENNQEIHDINKRFDKLERENKILKETLNKNIKIVEKLHKIIEELNNGKIG